MKVEPAAGDLLATARATLLEEVVPALAGPQRYAALMVANALAIAGRDLAAAGEARAELARLGDLLGDGTESGDQAGDLREATARLARRIRAGEYADGTARARLLACLRESTRARLAVSNPKALSR